MTILVKIPQIWVKIWQMSSNPPPQAYTFILSVKNQNKMSPWIPINWGVPSIPERGDDNGLVYLYFATCTGSIQRIYYFETLTFKDSMQLLPPGYATGELQRCRQKVGLLVNLYSVVRVSHRPAIRRLWVRFPSGAQSSKQFTTCKH